MPQSRRQQRPPLGWIGIVMGGGLLLPVWADAGLATGRDANLATGLEKSLVTGLATELDTELDAELSQPAPLVGVKAQLASVAPSPSLEQTANQGGDRPAVNQQVISQPVTSPQVVSQQFRVRPEPPSLQPLPEPQLPPPLPPADQLLRPLPPSSDGLPTEGEGETVFVRTFRVVGSTVFSDDELAAITAPFSNRSLSLTELYQVRSAITQLYLDRGYITSGAFIPPQVPEDGVITIQIVEGRVDEINVRGNRRLQSAYVRDRLAIAAATPLNVNRLVDALRLLQLDPLINNVSADLASGVEPGSSLLTVDVTEADTFSVILSTDNERSPAVSTWQRQIQFNQANLLGLGDGLSVSYANTRGSNSVDTSYTLPINARNGTLRFNYGLTGSNVVEDQFEFLDIESDSRYYELTYRQPILQTPTEEIALSLTASRQESRSLFLEEVLGDGIPFPSVGADDQGRSRVSALRFTQEWTRQGDRQVFAARSQFSLGLDLFDATVNAEGPDTRFFAWQGQGQWVRLLAPETLLIVRTEAQLADGALPALERFGLGGQRTVRGYRQDNLLTDNALLATAEVRIPVYRNRELDGLLHLIPFADIGTGWNSSGDDPDPSTLVGVGLGLQWRQGDRFSARLDWGIPLVSVESEGNTWQEDGIYFSIRYSAF